MFARKKLCRTQLSNTTFSAVLGNANIGDEKKTKSTRWNSKNILHVHASTEMITEIPIPLNA